MIQLGGDRRRRARAARRRRPRSPWWSSARAATRRCWTFRFAGRENVETVPAARCRPLKFVRDGRSAYDTTARDLARSRRALPAGARHAAQQRRRRRVRPSPGARRPLGASPWRAADRRDRLAIRRPGRKLARRRDRHAHALQLGQLRGRRSSRSRTVAGAGAGARGPSRAAASRSSTSSPRRTSSSRARWPRASRPASRR